jgi:hypothetical protein
LNAATHLRYTSAYVSRREYTSAYVIIRSPEKGGHSPEAYVSIRQHTSAYVSIRQHTSAAYVSIRQHTSAFCEDASLNADAHQRQHILYLPLLLQLSEQPPL